MATTEMQQLAARMDSGLLAQAIGLAGAEEVRDYYVRLDGERANKMGGRRTHFYAQAAESTVSHAEGDTAVIEVTEPVGLAQRIHGGTIVAGKSISSKTSQPTKHLSIPATAEAYGRRAGEFDDLVPVFRRIGGYLKVIGLARAQQTPVKTNRFRKDGTFARGKRTGGEILFWLKESVTQLPDPTSAPNVGMVVERARAAVVDYLSQFQGGIETA